jgi:hypothetical protein
MTLTWLSLFESLPQQRRRRPDKALPRLVSIRRVPLNYFDPIKDGRDRRGGRSSLDAHRSNKRIFESKGFEITSLSNLTLK